MFYDELSSIVNSDVSRSILLHGNIRDLYCNDTGKYVQLAELLRSKMDSSLTQIPVIYTTHDPVKFGKHTDALEKAFDAATKKGEFARYVAESRTNRSAGLLFIRNLSEIVPKNFFIVIEAVDLLVPPGNGGLSGLSEAEKYRLGLFEDWLSDIQTPGRNTIVLTADSCATVHSRLTSLPQIALVECGLPTESERLDFINTNQFKGDGKMLAEITAGLTLQAVRQVLAEIQNTDKAIDDIVINRVERLVVGELGEGVVEFKRPTHKLEDVIGNSKLKKFLMDEFIPRFKAGGDAAMSGAAVAGPIGAGKTFIFEAVAGELGVPIILLKNLRSQWFGQTDVIFEKIRRLLSALGRVVILVDEADTQFGNVGEGTHETERRLTGKIQAMMSDPALRGRVMWLLLTARIDRLSPDIRRPGRAGDLILPVLDPTGKDREAFLNWALKDFVFLTTSSYDYYNRSTENYSAAEFASLRSNLKAALTIKGRKLCTKEVRNIIDDLLSADLSETRDQQAKMAIMNCTRLSLLPDSYDGCSLITAKKVADARKKWRENI